jgi:hypothetical protein
MSPVPEMPLGQPLPTERENRALSRRRGSTSRRFNGFGHSRPRFLPRFVSQRLIARTRFSRWLSARYDFRPILCQAIHHACRSRSSTGARLRSGFAQSRPLADASKVAQFAAKPAVSDRHDLDGAIHHLRVRRYARRKALATDWLGDASQWLSAWAVASGILPTLIVLALRRDA